MREIQPLAERGDAAAQTILAAMYRTGRGVTKNQSKALKWYRRAADQGFAKVLYSLGLMYESGQGVTASESEALRWYRRAADAGDAAAQSNIGLLYYEGRGVAENFGEALLWLRRAAEQGYAVAQYNLGLLYVKDRGIPADHVQAHMWWSLAADQGVAQAATYRDEMARSISPEQITEAQKLALEWRATHNTAKAESAAKAEMDAEAQANRAAEAKRDAKAEKAAEAEKAAQAESAAKASHEKSPAASDAAADFTAGKEAYQRADYEAALNLWRPHAEQGLATAQFGLGVLFAKGQGVAKNASEAVKWYLKRPNRATSRRNITSAIYTAAATGCPRIMPRQSDGTARRPIAVKRSLKRF